MSEIARYDIEDTYTGHRVNRHPDGDYVEYTDHLAARAADAAEIERLRAELAECKSKLAEAKNNLRNSHSPFCSACFEAIGGYGCICETAKQGTRAEAARLAERVRVLESHLKTMRQHVAVDGYSEDGEQKLIGLAYGGSMWGPCYDPTYEPWELLEAIEKWLHEKIDAALSTAPADVKPDTTELFHLAARNTLRQEIQRLEAENAELRTKLAEHNRHPGFRCPSCGGSFFGRDVTNDAAGNPQCLPTVNCHDEFGVKCKWRGVWPERSLSQISDK